MDFGLTRFALAGISFVALAIAAAIPVLGKWNAMMPENIPIIYGGDPSTATVYNYSGDSSTATVYPNPFIYGGDPSTATTYDFEEEEVPEPISCFICQYQDFPACAGAHDQPGCEAVKVGGLSECQWYTPDGENPQCVSRMFPECSMDWRVNAYDEVCYATKPIVTNQERELSAGECRFSQNCNPMEYLYSGHSGPHRCDELFGNVLACMDLSNLTPEQRHELDFINTGCSTFQDVAQVYRGAEELRREMIVSGFRNFRVTLGGHTAMSGSCQSLMTLVITSEGIDTTYGPCPIEGAPLWESFCYGEGELRRCQDQEGGGVRGQVCCNGPEELYRGYNTRWVDGDICPELRCSDLDPVCSAGHIIPCANNGVPTAMSCCTPVPDAPPDAPPFSWQEGDKCPMYRCEDYNGACNAVGRAIDCKYPSGTDGKRTCCVTRTAFLGGETREWKPGNICPAPIVVGLCEGNGSRYYCTDATADALSNGQACLSTRSAECDRNGGMLIRSPCSTTVQNNGWVFGSCNIRAECPWQCIPRPPVDA